MLIEIRFYTQEVNGLKTGLKSVLWSGAALLLLLSFIMPLINFLTVLLVMVPFVVLRTLLPRKSFLWHAIAVIAAATAITLPFLGFGYALIGFFFLIPAVAMGSLYRQQAPASKVIRSITVLILMELMLMMLFFQVFFDLSLIKELGTSIRDITDTMERLGVLPEAWTSDQTEQLVRMVTNMIPVAFITFAFCLTVVTHYIARRIVNREEGVQVPAFTPAREWRLPRGLVLLYLIVFLAEMFTSKTSHSFMAIAVFTLVPLLQYIFAIQAIGFFFFLAHERRWNKAVPVLIAIPVLLFPPLSLIGVLDTAFPIRKSFKKS